MTPKEALKKVGGLLTQTYTSNGINAIWTSKLVKDSCEYKAIEQALTKLEGLKRDVKRFMGIANDCVVIDGCIREYIDLRRKLSKVGDEDV